MHNKILLSHSYFLYIILLLLKQKDKKCVCKDATALVVGITPGTLPFHP